MMPLCYCGGWFMVTSCIVCGVETMSHSYLRPLVHIWPLSQLYYRPGYRR